MVFDGFISNFFFLKFHFGNFIADWLEFSFSVSILCEGVL